MRPPSLLLLSLHDAELLLGCGLVDVTSRGWTVGAQEWVTPKEVASSKGQETSAQQLSQLTSYLVHLEAK